MGIVCTDFVQSILFMYVQVQIPVNLFSVTRLMVMVYVISILVNCVMIKCGINKT